ncbi:MAG: mercuric reductase [Pyrinomonadaceae bacterium]
MHLKQPDYDVLVIGGGQAGIPLALELAKQGKRVALAERDKLGGSCVNFGCTPTKAVIASARVAQLARRGAEFGLRIPTVEVDFAGVLERASLIAAESRSGLERNMSSDNPKLLRGTARLEGLDGEVFRVSIGEKMVTAQEVVLNTGTRSLIPPIEGLEDVDFIDAGNWLHKRELPAHLAVAGGSYVGVEMAQFYRRMGSRVTVIQPAAQIVEREDKDVADALRRLLEAEGIEFRLYATVQRVEVRDSKAGGNDKLTLWLDEVGAEARLDASHIFIATGRKPNTDDLGLETIGVRVSDHGIVEANERLSTNVPGVWVAGDIRGGAQFTHTSWDDYRILLSQMTGDGLRTTRRIVPYAIYTDPELGRVGMTEGEARDDGREFKVSHYEMRKNGKAREIGESEGFIKVIVDAATDKLLGAAVLASGGAELVHIYVDLMNADAPYTVLRDAVHIHPTLAEAVQSATKSL